MICAIPKVIPGNTYFHQGFTATWFLAAILVTYASFQRGYVLEIPVLGRVLEHLGGRSYALYLLHIPLQRVDVALCRYHPSYASSSRTTRGRTGGCTWRRCSSPWRSAGGCWRSRCSPSGSASRTRRSPRGSRACACVSLSSRAQLSASGSTSTTRSLAPLWAKRHRAPQARHRQLGVQGLTGPSAADQRRARVGTRRPHEHDQRPWAMIPTSASPSPSEKSSPTTEPMASRRRVSP